MPRVVPTPVPRVAQAAVPNVAQHQNPPALQLLSQSSHRRSTRHDHHKVADLPLRQFTITLSQLEDSYIQRNIASMPYSTTTQVRLKSTANSSRAKKANCGKAGLQRTGPLGPRMQKARTHWHQHTHFIDHRTKPATKKQLMPES